MLQGSGLRSGTLWSCPCHGFSCRDWCRRTWNPPSVAFAKGSKGKEALAWPQWEQKSTTRVAGGDFLGLVHPHPAPLCSSPSVSQGYHPEQAWRQWWPRRAQALPTPVQ